MKSDRKALARVNVATAGSNEIIAAQTSPAFIEIDHVTVLPSGGGQTLTFLDGATTLFSMTLDDNQAWVFDNASGDYPIVLSPASAFNISLSAATQVDGVVLYRVVNETF